MPTYSENGKNSYTAAAAVAKGDVLKFTTADAQGLPSVTPTTAATDAAVAVALADANSGEKVAVKILGTGGTRPALRPPRATPRSASPSPARPPAISSKSRPSCPSSSRRAEQVK